MALVLKRVEPDAGWPLELDTRYGYDQFGNVTTSMKCASDFGSCGLGMTNPSATGATDPADRSDPVHHPPFRTTTVSYDPAVLGSGAVSYGPGRFPSQTTNVLGQFETTVYDPVLGKVLKKTGPNGIETCFVYDPLGRPLSQTERCESAAPLTTATRYFLSLAASSPPNSATVTITTPPSNATTWSFSDDQGKSTGVVSYAFDGGFIGSTAAYNALGQVTQVAKPFHLASAADRPSPSYTKTTYDHFNRVDTVTDPLGIIDNTGVSKATAIVTTYSGSTVTTSRVVNGQTQTRSETKNAIGKVATVTTLTETSPTFPSTISYTYDADGNLTFTADPYVNQVQTVYDSGGRKSSTIDPDMGTWTYVVDGFGDVVAEVDAIHQSTGMTCAVDPSKCTHVMVYDALARMISKTDATGTARWVYDTATGAGKGKLAMMVSAPDSKLNGTCAVPTELGLPVGQRAVKSYIYTSFGELQEVDECAGGSSFATSYQYDTLGRQSSIRYPIVNTSQLAVGYHYNSAGYLQYLTDDSSFAQPVLWQAKAMNELGQVTDEQMQNDVETVSSRNPLTGWLLGTSAIAHADQDRIIQDWGYEFDEIGNLLTRNRADAINPVSSSETFTYDLTNRLLTSTVTTSGNYNRSEVNTYDLIGNLTQKGSAQNGYTYGSGCQAGPRTAGPHAVCTVAGGAPFTYDANGNLTKNGSRSATYNPSNKVIHLGVDNSTTSVDFMYGADGNRVVQASTTGGVTSRTVYVGLGGTGKSLYEQTTTGSSTKHVHYIYAGGAHGGAAFALRVLDDSGVTNKYYSFDHLGSVTAMSDDQGHVSVTGPDATAFGYDSWGARRNPDGTFAPPESFNLQVGARQFTGQEQVPDVGLVNMNGRLYDPALGRFLSPDPNVQSADDLQSYNRYSYVRNNPFSYTDPTGYFWNELGHFFKSTFSNPMTDFEIGMSLVACVVAGPAGCMVVGLELTLLNSSVALANGAGFDQTILNATIGLGVGIATGGIGQELGAGAWGSLFLGSASAAVSTGISNVLSGKDFFQINVLGAAILTAAEGALTIGLTKVAALSQASARRGQGGEEDTWGGRGDKDAYEGSKTNTKVATAHLLSRQLNTDGLNWLQRLIIEVTHASHAGWVIETPDDGVYLIEGDCPKCTRTGNEGDLQSKVQKFDTAGEAYRAFGGPYYTHGTWSVPLTNFQAIADRFDAMNVAYDFAGANSNYFAHWFATQARIPMTIDPTGAWYLPGPLVYQWNYSPPK